MSVVVTLMNAGTAPINDVNFAQSGSTSSAIQMFNDGQPFGGITLGALDLTKQVQPKGGTVTCRPEAFHSFASARPAFGNLFAIVDEMAAVTREWLAPERVAWLSTLPLVRQNERLILMHGTPATACGASALRIATAAATSDPTTRLPVDAPGHAMV